MIVAKGTGIDVYNVIRTQMNFSFTMDGGSPSEFIYSWDKQCFGDTSVGSMYNSQSLDYGTYTLHITLLSYLRLDTMDNATESINW